MPVYDYRCKACDARFEVTRPMGSASKECCPACGAEARRVFTPIGVAFKGSGFHNTDYKSRPKEDSAPCPKKDGSSACSTCPAAD